jgi:hypothetical protein
MKRTAILAFAVVATTASFAQVNTTFGIKAGVQNNLLIVRETGGDDTRLALTGFGFHVGGVADLGFSEHFSVQPQLLFTSKGVKQSDESSISLLNIDIPINLFYKNNGFFVGGGPNFSYGLSAKSKTDGSPDQDLYEEDGGDAPLKRFGFGVNVAMGYTFPSGFTIGANYTPTLSNIVNDGGGDGEYNPRHYGFSIGYMFNKGAAKKK